MKPNEIRKRMPVAGLALILYVFLSLIYFGTTGNYACMYLGGGADPTVYIWCLNWWPWAIAHGLNPFVTHYIWYPEGFNMTWANSIPTAALLLLPVTWLANAVVSYNTLSLLAPALSAWTAFLLARSLTRNTRSSLIGGYLFGFSSYELGQMLGHLNLDLIFMVPLLVLLVVRRIRGDLSRPRFVAALAVALVVQLGLATEILATACVFGAITWAIFIAFAASEERRRLWAVAAEIILAAGIMVVLAAPFLFFIVKGLSDVPPLIHSPEVFSADLLNYLIPTKVTRLGSSIFGDFAHRFSGNLFEQGAYLGLPLILILILQLRDIRRRRYLKPLMASLLVILVLSLGPRLHVAGVPTNLLLPWRLALHLPFIREAVPTRFPMYVSLIAALAVALWLSEAHRGWGRARRFTLAVFACLCLVPNRAMVHWTPLPVQPFFQPQNVVAALGRSANVIVLPYGYTGPSLIWQWQSDMGYTQSGGYLSFDPPSEQTWAALQRFTVGAGGPSFENDISAFCVIHHVSAVLVGPGTPVPLAAALEAIHWQETENHGVRVVRVPDPRTLHFYYVSGDYWPSNGPDNWIGHHIKIVTCGRPVQLCITGRHRPSELGPVEIQIVNGSSVSRYRIAQQDAQVVDLPADASIVLTASATFVPARILRNGDERSLSVTISLQPDAESGQER